MNSSFDRGDLVIACKLFFEPLLLADENLTGFAALEGSDYSPFLHLVNDSGGAGVSELQLTLEKGSGSLSHFDDTFDSGVEHFVAVIESAAVTDGIITCFLAFFLCGKFFDIIKNVFVIGCGAAVFDKTDNVLDFLIAYETALNPAHIRLGVKEHITFPKEFFRAAVADDGTAVNLRRRFESDSASDV